VVSVLYKAMINFIFALQNILSVTHNYQPNPFSKKNRAGRDTYDRYNAILSNINETPKSVIDLGCNRGFFVLKTAAEGSISIGVDHDWFEIIYARALAEKNNTSNALFMNAEINSSFIDKLPSFDMVVCTSIFHHWVRIYGKEEAFDMMRLIALKTNKYLVFETGQYNEISTSWYKELSFMGDNYEEWIVNFLSKTGFKEVKPIGQFSTHLSDVKRTLFIASK
jgi:SAM-dependent methyltransferase